MLVAAGVDHEAVAANVDESAVKLSLGEPRSITLDLAAAKALDVSRSRPGDWVIGSDSVVSVDGVRYSKPKDREQAAEHLRAFSGRTMLLSSAVALANSGKIGWSHPETARLEVRPLNEKFIQDYLDAEWPEVGYCVGVFRMEGRGVTLFDRIEGNYFAILGMPLLPLLGALRDRGLMAA